MPKLPKIISQIYYSTQVHVVGCQGTGLPNTSMGKKSSPSFLQTCMLLAQESKGERSCTKGIMTLIYFVWIHFTLLCENGF